MTFALDLQIAEPVAWRETHKNHPRLVALADRHYTRQTPGSPHCCRPGVNFCLTLSDGLAAWVVWRPIPSVGRMDGLEAWECTLFRNESPAQSSGLIRAAVSASQLWRVAAEMVLRPAPSPLPPEEGRALSPSDARTDASDGLNGAAPAPASLTKPEQRDVLAGPPAELTAGRPRRE